MNDHAATLAGAGIGTVPILVHASLAFVIIIGLIVFLKVNAVIGLFLGTSYLGLTAGLGPTETVTAITDGFADIMAEIGLLITFGVLLGSMLRALGVFDRIAAWLIRITRDRDLPYAYTLVLMLLFPVLFTDVQMVLAAPLVRNLGKRLGPGGLAKMASATMMGSQLGQMFVVPGLSLLAITGLLQLPLTSILGYGLLVGIPTGVISVFLYAQLIKMRLWNPSTDELVEEPRLAERNIATADARAESTAHRAAGGTDEPTHPEIGQEPIEAYPEGTRGQDRPRLGISLLPLLLALALVVSGGVFQVVHGDPPGGFLGLLTNPVFALFLGFALSYAMVWRHSSSDRVDGIMSDGLKQCGTILVLTGISGSLAGVISASPLGDVLTQLFTASALTPLLLAWIVACVIHILIGSTSLAAISTAGILAPVLSEVATPAPLIALAIGSGALFAIQVNSNGFWMWQTLLNMTTRGTLKTVTLPTMLISVVSLGMILVISLFV